MAPTNAVMSEEEIREQRQLFVGEDEWWQVDKLVFFPVGPLKQCWDFAVLVCVIFSCVTVPYRNSFGEAEGEGHARLWRLPFKVALEHGAVGRGALRARVGAWCGGEGAQVRRAWAKLKGDEVDSTQAARQHELRPRRDSNRRR